MVGPNTMLASSQWIKRNMMGDYSEKLDRPLTEAEIRVMRCIEKLPVPDWYRKYSKSVKFLKNDTPIESRPPTWRTMKGKAQRSPRKTPSKQRVPEKIPANPLPSPRKAKPPPSPRKSLNSNYRIARKADKLRKGERLSISISPSSSDSESPAANVSPRLSRSLSNSHTFPRVQPSRKIQNINIVLPRDFAPKPARREARHDEASPPGVGTSTPRVKQYTLTKSIELRDDSDARSNESTLTLGQSSHTSFLFAEVEPGGVTTRVRVFAGMDSDSDEARSSASPHARFFNSRNKSNELERIVQSNRRVKRGDSLIREIIGELDRSVAESAARRNNSGGDGGGGGSNSSSEFVKSMVRALEQEEDEEEEEEVEYSSDSDLAKSTSISFKSLEGELASSSCGDEADKEEETTPLPTYDYEKDEEEEEEEVYWIPSKIRDLPRTSSRLSMLSRGSSRSGFQCTSGRCSPGLSPIKAERAGDEWTASLASHRSQKSALSRQLFRIDESQPIVGDSGCYSDRTASRTPNYCNEARIYASTSSSATPSPTLEHLDGITTEMLIDIYGRHQFTAHKSIAV